MSYSIGSGPEPITKDEIPSIEIPEPVIEAARTNTVEAEQIEHINVGRQVAALMAAVVGVPDDLVRVSISGHANPNHAPTAGWADEMMTISVSVQRLPI